MSVLDELKVRALYLDDRETPLLIISCDLLGLTVSRVDRLRGQVGAALGLPARNILLACTHTHSGPATEALPGLGRVDSDYVKRLPQAVMKAAELAAASGEDAEFGFEIEAAEPIGFNRRRRSFEEIDPVVYLNRRLGAAGYSELEGAGGETALRLPQIPLDGKRPGAGHGHWRLENPRTSR